jgi:aminopeptidase
MSPEFDKKLDKYAEVIIRVGLNIQSGQRLLIGYPSFGVYGMPLELAPLARLMTMKAYQFGAKLVEVIWSDDQMRLIRLQEAPRDSFEEFPEWRTNVAYEFAKAGDAIVRVHAENPDLLSEQDPDLVATAQRANVAHLQALWGITFKNVTNTAVITAPVAGWSKWVFPDLPAERRDAAFWDTLFEICRVNRPDPVAAWQDHVERLAAHSAYLNQKQYAALKYTGPGTDLTVGLPERHIWKSARATSQSGINYVSNLPTEEIYTTPHKDKTDGVITATRPLLYGGHLIEDFSLTFEEGRVVKATARRGEQILLDMLEMDEGARLLGEVALVPHSSPISQTGLLFYNILLDENASSHMALGRAYKACLEDGVAMSEEEFEAAGGNYSQIHVDFMVGSGEMDIDGLAEDGLAEAIMRNGEWVFEV